MIDPFQREWKVAKPAPACADCGRPTSPEATAYASLHEEGGTYARRDLCAPCWERTTDRGLSFWAYRPAPPPAPAPRADLAAIREFYLRLAGRESNADRLLRYLLGLYLVRKKRVWLDRAEKGPDGRETLWIRSEREGSAEAVVVPDFAPEDLAETRRRLDALLGIDVGQPVADDAAR